MKKIILLLCLFYFVCFTASSQTELKVKAFSIYAPSPENVDVFVDFIENELAANGINNLVLQIDYNYKYSSRPELREENPLTKEDVEKIKDVCKKHEIKLIPQVNLLGHQSHRTKLRKLLDVYPEFDETPHIKLPETYTWPNDDDLYCKSYCPLHPELHNVIFDLVDEIVDVFESKTFHAGLDEVFYIADSKCERCKGEDPAVVFANEVTKIYNHLQKKGVELMIWGDRLIDGKTTGIGMWEGSHNNTYRAIDMIPKEVIICDWHYKKALPTPSYFALKGFRVIACPWNQPEVAERQVEMMVDFIENSTPEMTDRFYGVMQTVWSDVDVFLKEYANYTPSKNKEEESQVASFKAMVEAINK